MEVDTVSTSATNRAGCKSGRARGCWAAESGGSPCPLLGSWPFHPAEDEGGAMVSAACQGLR